MKDLSVILKEIKETSQKLINEKKDNPLISTQQRTKNIEYFETKLNTLLFCADLEEINILLYMSKFNIKEL